ncbi:hypothetical protein [Rhodosalinus sediminis]|uniref:hypothetical protein n=1 Tax=Rhodosalinus sediminis TaxID=1940533 RepID=UPI002357ABD1|nr:hypothetical protein [Rhodosalinus sediminis]
MRWPHSRLHQITEIEGKPAPLVELESGTYLLEALLEAGPAVSDPHAGLRPLSWLEIWAYMQATAALAEPWEARALMEMSRAFVAGLRAGQDPLSIAPRDQDTH